MFIVCFTKCSIKCLNEIFMQLWLEFILSFMSFMLIWCFISFVNIKVDDELEKMLLWVDELGLSCISCHLVHLFFMLKPYDCWTCFMWFGFASLFLLYLLGLFASYRYLPSGKVTKRFKKRHIVAQLVEKVEHTNHQLGSHNKQWSFRRSSCLCIEDNAFLKFGGVSSTF